MQQLFHKPILVVDDQAATRMLIRKYLETDGYHVLDVASGEAAIELAKQSELGGILLDLKLPGIDGIETCRRIRAMPQHKMTPILIVTAIDEISALSKAFEAECDDFIVKPINHVVLRARLKGHIQRTELYYQLETVQKTLNRYISPQTQKIVEQYAGTGDYPPPVKRELCVLFTDIRGFTQLSQHIEPEELFTLLSRHLAYQVDLVYEFGGYVDKYAGDGIMALFEGQEMAQRACLCALDIIAHAHSIVSGEHSQLFSVGCGISQGQAVVGNIGSPEHLDYSVVGETVNLAARLCGHAEPMSIVVSKDIYAQTKGNKNFHYSEEQAIAVKGFEQAVKVYELTPQVID